LGDRRDVDPFDEAVYGVDHVAVVQGAYIAANVAEEYDRKAA
jgi:hypothetical protein